MSYDEHEFDSEEEIEIEAIGVEVTNEPIELYKVLKMLTQLAVAVKLSKLSARAMLR
ncbi:hypothetical protein JCM19241_5593 [Vibrio ishigakensis]|uniref:Uncharacterized protein n=1 Tax=Vibrio ishigakensis TaxID=1481914 RepID=A0A0B8QBW2_9VIBR|nr:hypothetical protein JCM19241_5593 [Vibrio ishigakensis]